MDSQPNQTTYSNFEDFLIDHGFLQKAALEQFQKIKTVKNANLAASDYQSIGQLLVAERILDEEEVTKAKAAFLNVPYVDLRKIVIKKEAFSSIPEESRNFYKIVPFEQTADALKVAIADPSNVQALEALEFLGQKQNAQVQIFLASNGSLETLLNNRKDISSVVGEALENIQSEIKPKEEAQVQSKPAVMQDAPIIKIVDVILENAIEANASDIHIEPSDNDVRVRYRIDGILHTSLRLPKNVLPAIISRIKILTNLKIDESRLPQDGRFHLDAGKRSVDLRVSILPLIYGEKVVMRILDKTSAVPTLENLGVRANTLDWVKDNIKKTHGIFLITGPTGSGKSTTLYAILSLLNTTAVNIITLEDPVEYFIQGVNQSQINPDIGLTFASGLRSILRQDPNIVMVGEIRDEETVELAVHAALTGHLVFSTLHTNNAVGAIPRMINMGIEPFLLEAAVNLVLAQRLVRKICEHCKVEAELAPAARTELERELEGVPEAYLSGLDIKLLKIFKGKGCDKCGHTGYKGRLGIYEALPMMPEVQDLLAKKTQAGRMYQEILKFGIISMKQDGVVKVLRGETTMDEVFRVTSE
jgi:type IV pilus assembly protein PilB